MKTKIANLDKFLNENPNIKKILFFLVGFKSIPALVISAGIMCISNPIYLPLIYFLFDKNVTFKDFTEPNIIQFSIGVLLVLLGCLLYYCTKKQNDIIDITPNNKNDQIRRIKDLPLFGKRGSFLLFLIILFIELAILILIYYSWSKPIYDIGRWYLLSILLRIITLMLLLYLIQHTANMIGCIVYLIRGKKIVILYKKKNIFIECGKDGYLYLTSYQFYTCESCCSSMYLDRKNEQHYLVCSQYGNQHIRPIDPAEFDKFSHPYF